MSKLPTEEELTARVDLVSEAIAPAEEDRQRDATAALFWSGTDEAENALYAASNSREMALWPGDMLPLKRVLQRAGLSVFHADKHGTFTGKRGPWIAVGKAVVSHEDFRAWAERTRRAARLQRAA